MSADTDYVREFLLESNRIEGIHGPVGEHLIAEMFDFVHASVVTVEILCSLARSCAAAELRDKPGMDVRVGYHVPPRGGPNIHARLVELLNRDELTPYQLHAEYEALHPFMDGNGRTGRALWLWAMYQEHERMPRLGFLHQWYYQSLDAYRSDDA